VGRGGFGAYKISSFLSIVLRSNSERPLRCESEGDSAMNVDEQKIAEQFCFFSLSAYEAWRIRRFIFDDASIPRELLQKAGEFYKCLGGILHEYSLLQIQMILDKAYFDKRTRLKPNLTVAYVVEELNWKEDSGRVSDIYQEMLSLMPELKEARNKRLAHLDLKTCCEDDRDHLKTCCSDEPVLEPVINFASAYARGY